MARTPTAPKPKARRPRLSAADKEVDRITRIVKARPPEERKFFGTEQQMRFVNEWAAGNTVYGAAVRAGYTDGGALAYQMVRMPEVQALYAIKVKEREAAARMSMEKFMGMLQEAYDMAKLQAEPMTMVAAAREIGKACGYYAPVERKVTIQGNEVLDKLDRMTNQQLLEVLNSEPKPAAPVAEQIAAQEMAEMEAEDGASVDPRDDTD